MAPELTQTVEEQQEIVVFESDLAVVSEGLPMEVPIPVMPSIQHTDYDEHSIKSYLRRPQLLQKFRWLASAARSDNILPPTTGNNQGLRVPTGLFRNRTMTLNKLDGLTSFKATCVLKLEINTHPFQAGRLLMAAVPMPDLLGNRKNFIFSHVANAQNVHHVQMDIAKDTEVELRIPFISPYNCFDLIDGKFDWAEVRILVYSPIAAVSTRCLELSLHGYFEDIELGFPTSGSVRQQSRMPSVSTIDDAKRKEATGTFTGALAQLGTSLMNKARPMLGVADAAASAFGWSKPILAQPSQVVLNRPTEGFQYMDGVDNSLVLGMTASNAVEPIPGLVGTAADETAFNTLMRIPQCIAIFEYSSTQTGGDIDCTVNADTPKLWETAVSPSYNVPACYYIRPSTTDPGGTDVRNPYELRWKQPTTLNYITSPFLYWKGSLVYTFKFVKTNYHSGRVEISFHPFVNTVDSTRMDYTRRWVIDLQKKSEISVTIPYVSAQPYKRISTFLDPVNPDPPAPGRLKDICTGMLYVRAITPLICSTSIIASRIEVLVEVRAGDDFEVGAPITSKFLPFSIQNPGNPVQQMGLPDLRNRSEIGRIWTNWNAVGNGTSARMTNLAQYSKIHLYLTGDAYGWSSNNGVYTFKLTPNWNNSNPGNNENYQEYSVIFGFTGTSYSFEQHIIIDNPNHSNTLYLWLNRVAPTGNVTNNANLLVDALAHGLEERIQVETGGDSGGVVRIAEDQLPLRTQVTNIPLPVLSEGGAAINNVRIVNDQYPLQIQQPVQIRLLQEQFPLEVAQTQLPLPVAMEGGGGVSDVRIVEQPVNVNVSNVPLPVTGGGGGPGGTVSIDPCQLPLWVSEYNVAPRNPRAECPHDETIVKRPRQQSGQTASAGITETRTRAIQGWMPPSITGSSIDAHRPSLAHLCIGEKFESFRQYAKRFAFCMVAGLDSSKMFPIQPIELIRPGALYLRPTTASTGNNERTQLCLYAPNTQAELSGSPLAFVSGMYAFYRGSVRVKVWMDPRENPPNLLSGHLEYSRQTVDSNIIDDNIENFMTPIAYETPQSKQLPEFQVPYYSPTIVSSIWSHGIDNQFDTPLANLVLSIPDFRTQTQNFPIKVAVAAGDDMDFHQFIGPPPVINVGDLTINQRPIHYPPTGFTPTQKIALDTPANRRTELPASSFIPVPYSVLSLVNNFCGRSCPAVPSSTMCEVTTASPTVTMSTHSMHKRSADPMLISSISRPLAASKEGGYDTVDSKPKPCPCSHSLDDYLLE